jgi:hypothetical protein
MPDRGTAAPWSGRRYHRPAPPPPTVDRRCGCRRPDGRAGSGCRSTSGARLSHANRMGPLAAGQPSTILGVSGHGGHIRFVTLIRDGFHGGAGEDRCVPGHSVCFAATLLRTSATRSAPAPGGARERQRPDGGPHGYRDAPRRPASSATGRAAGPGTPAVPGRAGPGERAWTVTGRHGCGRGWPASHGVARCPWRTCAPPR